MVLVSSKILFFVKRIVKVSQFMAVLTKTYFLVYYLREREITDL
jgi:hypothetical protein